MAGQRRDSDPERGAAGERQEQAGGKHPVLTTAQGIAVPDNQNSLRPWARGPGLIEDFVLREKITHFDHERIPERIVHARGSAAHGYFQLTRSLAEYTTAGVLTDLKRQTPVFCRFSTVVGGAGSVDTPRDVRGFAVKFYTEEGNWDLVGNNIPVFFIQDAMKFPDLIHAVKMEPDRGWPQAATAHDTFWDFISLMPESMHMIMWAMSDRTLPRSFRTMEGFGIHSFRLVNAQGESTFVKFHWRPKLGIQSTVWDEAAKLQAADNDFLRRDLWESIAAGQYPQWELAVQLFTEADAQKFPFDHLDSTKLIPEEMVPLMVIGTMVLDRNPDNLFAETEQAAYCPANVVPGIDFSDDPLLQGRLFSYLDTQLLRLGGPNFHQLPINAPKCPFAYQLRDGKMQMQVPASRVAYEPSSLNPANPLASRAKGFVHFAEPSQQGSKSRLRPESFADHFSQARLFFRSQSQVEQAHMASALVFELSKVETAHVRLAMLKLLRNVDESLARRVADGLGVADLPTPAQPAAPVQDMEPSPALRIIDRMKPTLEGRHIGVLVSSGTDMEAVGKLRKAAQAEGARVTLVAPRLGIRDAADQEVAADKQLAGTPSCVFDAVAGILSLEEGRRLSREAAAVDWFRDAFGHLKAIAACKGTRLILSAGSIEPDEGVVEPGQVGEFLKLAATRQWQREPRVRTLN